ncbi:dTDP-glucose 4,6-dehydratase [Robiginitalea sp. SC105]|uniref:dTDP-glucose 4,6-dehydratase n=1 Tax=Robiginitalea sp. SC105 TaxID=2762332 RepID=UPI00163A5037|nr:dTDP-glucose 4,6-dehydratase [Robiginitalea sp. SC105]MBC2838227.1 dTDP-glucose 4,6-dehydratase [Robiginitalea sp. SC105]
MPERILITGGCGFIGSNFIRLLMEQRDDVHIVNLDKLTYAGTRENLSDLEGSGRYQFVQGDVADAKKVREIFDNRHIDGIIHFAAESHVDNSISGPEPFVRTNIDGTFVLLEAARNFWTCSLEKPSSRRFLHISTDEVFGSLGAEGHFDENSCYRPNSPYSASKAASDLLVRSYHKTYGLNTVISNCSNNFGPYQHREKLIPTVIRKALAGEGIPIYGEGKNVRDWLYVEDHCEALLRIYYNAPAGANYVIGGGNELSNIDLVRRICGILDRLQPLESGKSYTDQIQFVADRPGHDFRYAVDDKKVRRELGWAPRTRFEKGLEATVGWYIDIIKSA